MKNSLKSIRNKVQRTGWRLFSAGLLLAASTAAVYAQGDVPSGTIFGSGAGPSFSYDLSFSDAASAAGSIGSVWYAWVPGSFFLPSQPTTASAPAGWNATIMGDSIQFVANASTDDIAPGQTLSGFTFSANFSPSQLAAAPNSGESDAYTIGLFSDGGKVFTVQGVPEPSPLTLMFGAAGLLLFSRRGCWLRGQAR